MTTATELLRRHFETLLDHPDTWQTLIADDLVWELPYAPSIGDPEKLEGRAQITSFLANFRKVMEGFRFFDLRIHTIAEDTAVAEVHAEAEVRPTGRPYAQTYIVFLEARDGRIVRLREYFNPAKAAWALNVPILELAA